MTERDTHFQAFAKLLWHELMMAHGSSYGYIDVSTNGLDADLITDYQQIIARRAYDLAYHVLTQEFKPGRPFVTKHFIQLELERIPDLTQWPDLPDSE